MSKEHLFIDLKMWVREGSEGQSDSIRYSYHLPNIDDDLIAELYEIFLETLCLEIAKLEGAASILSMLAEKADDSS